MDSRITEYRNGPLPAHLESAAYFTDDRDEWALPKAWALEYLDWCEQRGLRVLGFEVWYPTAPGPTVTDIGLGNVEGVVATREGIRNHPGRYASGSVVFNITVGDQGPVSAAG
jgi:hypothetical protein